MYIHMTPNHQDAVENAFSSPTILHNIQASSFYVKIELVGYLTW